LQRVSQLAETWDLLSYITKEKETDDGNAMNPDLNERQYSKAYFDVDQASVEAKDLRRTVRTGALSFLEDQYVQHLELPASF